MIRASWPTLTENLRVLDRREAILDLAPMLEELAERCRQPGAMHWLHYFLDEQVAGRRVPYLILVLRPQTDRGCSLTADDVEAAALYFEYKIFGLRTGAVATGDAVGFNSVIAPEGQRTLVAALAARVLIERGASVVLTTFEGRSEPEAKPLLTGWQGVLSAERHRTVGRALRLLPTLDETLAQMGKSTRFNLRYYRRRLAKLVPCEYIPDAAVCLRPAELHALNRASLNPVPAAEFDRRIRCASELPGSFLSGLRATDGRWLSLTGGWRQGGTTVLYWQLNSQGLEKHSIGTVMRSFFLEHEIARGATKLLIFGGTPHPMRHAFEQDAVADLVVRRHGLRAGSLCWVSRFFTATSRFGRRGNFLASTLQDPKLIWTANPGTSTEKRPLIAKPEPSRHAA